MKSLILSIALCGFAFVASCPAADQAATAPKAPAAVKPTTAPAATVAVKAKTEECDCDGKTVCAIKLGALRSPKALAGTGQVGLQPRDQQLALARGQFLAREV